MEWISCCGTVLCPVFLDGQNDLMAMVLYENFNTEIRFVHLPVCQTLKTLTTNFGASDTHTPKVSFLFSY